MELVSILFILFLGLNFELNRNHLDIVGVGFGFKNNILQAKIRIETLRLALNRDRNKNHPEMLRIIGVKRTEWVLFTDITLFLGPDLKLIWHNLDYVGVRF